MTRERLADAYEEQAALLTRLAEVTAQIAHELRGIEPAAARAAVPAAGVVSPPAPVLADPPLSAQVDAGLGVCPIHGVHWTVKAAGVSKVGKPYEGFWKCAERDGDEFCTQKPQKIWRDTHPIREVAA